MTKASTPTEMSKGKVTTLVNNATKKFILQTQVEDWERKTPIHFGVKGLCIFDVFLDLVILTHLNLDLVILTH